ncbi:uncharacterized protein TNCV_1702801 [Trichonephila clavipes]|nr:uncharacterized protein TNCV_1702801 [Trichonephila clavipes]
MSRRAFLDRRECIESKIKIETEKNQEEKFLQSILPMHIAREVRNDIREAIKDMNRLRMSHKPFNKLYVEKHKGVRKAYTRSKKSRRRISPPSAYPPYGGRLKVLRWWGVEACVVVTYTT